MSRTLEDRADTRAERSLAAAGLPPAATTGKPLLVAARLVRDTGDSNPEPLDDLADNGPPRYYHQNPTRAYWLAQVALDQREGRPS